MLPLALALIAATPPTDPIRLATYRYPRYDRAKALEPLQQLLASSLKLPVTVTLYDSPDALRDAVRSGRVDVAVTNLASFVGMCGTPRLETIGVLDVPAATLDRYRGVLLARPDAGVQTIADLKGKEPRLRYAEVLPGSTSGALVQATRLRDAGVNITRFKTRVQAGTHEAALIALTDNRTDLAALAEEPWREATSEERATVVELWRSAPLPPGPVVCVSRMTFNCKTVRALLLGRKAGLAAIQLSRGWSETEGAKKFRRVRMSDYRAFVGRSPLICAASCTKN